MFLLAATVRCRPQYFANTVTIPLATCVLCNDTATHLFVSWLVYRRQKRFPRHLKRFFAYPYSASRRSCSLAGRGLTHRCFKGRRKGRRKLIALSPTIGGDFGTIRSDVSAWATFPFATVASSSPPGTSYIPVANRTTSKRPRISLHSQPTQKWGKNWLSQSVQSSLPFRKV